jgi:hypothetical protein
MWRVFGGAALVIAGVAAFIEAHSHRPLRECPGGRESCYAGMSVHVGLSQTPYDVLRIGAWAIVIVGALLIVVGLVGYWGAQRRAPGV